MVRLDLGLLAIIRKLLTRHAGSKKAVDLAKDVVKEELAPIVVNRYVRNDGLREKSASTFHLSSFS